MSLLVLWWAIVVGTGCKVPINDVNAGFALADAAWFQDEQTLFLFWEVFAEQGIGDPSVVEITYVTDTEEMPWTPVDELVTVHEHVPVNCGASGRCGSASLRVPNEPRGVRMRLRYHREGALALDAETVFNVVGSGPPHQSRSYVAYGVFDGSNTYVQWRGRHQFPTIRNEQASELGLRRQLTISNQRFGNPNPDLGGNPYAYAEPCPDSFVPLGFPNLTTSARAAFNEDALPLGAGSSEVVCALSTVTDGRGTFQASAYARKNPEVRPAFPLLRSPIRSAKRLSFFLAPCERQISPVHEAMQRQRLLIGSLPPICTDDGDDPTFVDQLVVTFREAIEAARPEGRDMVLAIGIHQDDDEVPAAVEAALAQLVPAERHRSSPRVAGAFVFDSTVRGLVDVGLAQTTLWCPSTFTGDLASASERSCPVLPDETFDLGPFTFGTLPILPTRDQYLEFLEDFSEQLAGETLAVDFRVPEFATTSEHIDFGPFGVVTFLDGETIFADPEDAFSFCTQDEFLPFAVRSDALSSPEGQKALTYACELGYLPPEVCEIATDGLLPLDFLPTWHGLVGETTYDVGLFWEFPFLLDVEFRAAVAGSVTAFGFTVPFGVSGPGETLLGSQTWSQSEFRLDEALTQCRRFCDHPTFDSAGVYHVTDPFRSTYANLCYAPDYPALGSTGFPVDP